MDRSRPRNWLLKLALVALSTAIAALGVFGWADKARLFDAVREAHASAWGFLAALDPLWPVFAVAALGCIAAQVIAGCCTVNFARLAKAPPIWRGVAAAFYAVSVFFAAYSADMGAQIVLGLPHRAAYEAREEDRRALSAEIAAINSRLREAARRLDFDPSATYTTRQESALAGYNALTAIDRARLPIAQRELDARPPIPRERALEAWEQAVFFIFLAWAALEPWGYALAERGRVDLPGQNRRPRPRGPGPFTTMLHWVTKESATRARAVAGGARKSMEVAAAAAATALALDRRGRADSARAPAEAKKPRSPSARAATLGEKPTRRDQRALARRLLLEGLDLPLKERQERGLAPSQIALRTGVPPGAIRRWGTFERRARERA